MTSTSIVFNNTIMNVEDFVDKILTTDINIRKIPSCEIQELKDYYSINLNSFIKDLHTFQIYYKNNFLILQIKLRDDLTKTLSTRMFFLPDINTKKISHTYYADSVNLKIQKINFFNI